jgi:bacterioferritin
MKPTVLQDVSTPGPPLTDIQAMRSRARQYIEEGVVTSGYGANRETVIKLLNDALAIEMYCILRYRRHYFKAAAMDAAPVVTDARGDIDEEMEHTKRIAARVVPLREKPNLSPIGQARYVEGVTRRAMNQLREMISKDLITGSISVESYRETLSYQVEQDPMKGLFNEILADQDHAPDLSQRSESPIA